MSAGTYRKVIMLFGALHVVLSARGLSMTITSVFLDGFLHDSPDAPFVVECFYGMTATNILFLAAVAFAGYRLIRQSTAAIRFSNYVCLGEIFYLLLLPFLWMLPRLGLSFASATGIANVGVMVQADVFYPPIAWIALTFCRWRLSKSIFSSPHALSNSHASTAE